MKKNRIQNSTPCNNDGENKDELFSNSNCEKNKAKAVNEKSSNEKSTNLSDYDDGNLYYKSNQGILKIIF